MRWDDAVDVITPPLVSTERVGDALVVTLARAPVNAINDELLAQLDAVLDEAEADERIAVLHLRSALKVFCGGADLALIRSCMATPQGRNEMVAIVQRMQRVFARLEAVGCVTIAELGGATVGGGFELALACDWRIAAHEARIGLPEAGLGLLAAGGGTQRLTHLVGPGIARRLILGAETVDGIEAERLGLVQWSVPRAQLERCRARAGAALRRAYRVWRWPRTSTASHWPVRRTATASPPRSPPRGACTNTLKPGAACRPSSEPEGAATHAHTREEDFSHELDKDKSRHRHRCRLRHRRGHGANLLAGAGATVIVADVQTDKGEAQAAALRDTGAKAKFLRVDMTDAGIDRRLRRRSANAIRCGGRAGQRRRLGHDASVLGRHARAVGPHHRPELHRPDAPDQGAAARR